METQQQNSSNGAGTQWQDRLVRSVTWVLRICGLLALALLALSRCNVCPQLDIATTHAAEFSTSSFLQSLDGASGLAPPHS